MANLSDEIFVKITAETNKAMKNVADLAKSFGSAYLSVEAFKKIIVSSFDEFIRSEVAVNKLTNALKATGNYTAGSVSSLLKLSSALQGTTVYADDVTQSAMTMLIQLGGLSAEMAGKTIPAVQDFAAAMGIDLEQAATIVGKSLDGTTNMLGRYGIQIDTAKTGSDRLADVTQKLNEKFGGMAKSVGDTAYGSIQKLKNAVSDLQEEMGRAMVRNLGPFLKWLTDMVAKAAEGYQKLNDLRDAMKAMADGTATASQKIVILKADLIDLKRQADITSAGLTRTGSTTGAFAGYSMSYTSLGKPMAGFNDNEEISRLINHQISGLQAQIKANERIAQQNNQRKKDEQEIADITDGLANSIAGSMGSMSEGYGNRPEHTGWSQGYSDLYTKQQQAAADALERQGFEARALLNPLREMKEISEADYIVIQHATDAMADRKRQTAELASNMQGVADAAVAFGDALARGDGAGAIAGLIRQASSMRVTYAITAAAAAAATFNYPLMAFWLGVAGLGVIGAVGASAIQSSGGGSSTHGVPAMADGGIVTGPTLAMIGEAGPEAVVPLGRGVGGVTIHVHGSIWQTDDLARAVARRMGRW